MKPQKLNLFIVDDNALLATDLKLFLEKRFGTDLTITTFRNGESCLKMVNDQTNIVILDYFLEGENGLEILKSIKAINPNTEVIMHSGNDDIAVAIQSFRAGAKDYVVKGTSDFKKLTKIITQILLAPINLLVREFGVSKMVAIFLLTFVIMGIAVAITTNMMKD